MPPNGSEATYSPVALIVEDDPLCARYLRGQFHDRTNVGVLLATDLRTGLNLAEEMQFDVLVSDIYFDVGTEAEERDVFDGVDLAEAVKESRPEIPFFFMSFMAGDAALHEKARRKQLVPEGWLQKTFAATPDSPPPWKIIEHYLAYRQLNEQRDEGEVDLEGLLESQEVALALRLRRPIRTFIQELPDQSLVVRRPVEAFCTLDEGLARASAPSLGLVQEGFGETVQDALDELAKVIQEQFVWLTESATRTDDYADVVRQQLKGVVARKEED